MAPPAGTSSMLRSRRRDATLKPNRTLDRSASRGMLYENEELRLRTININAEVEKGQNYIKKLRRENEQLKREIWNLREEYERLENYVKSREQSENEEEYEEEEEDDNDDNDDIEAVITVEPTEVATDTTAVAVLETVVEEDDDVGDQELTQKPEGHECIADDNKNVEPQNSNSPGVDDPHEINNHINNKRCHVTVSGAPADPRRDAVTDTACATTATVDCREGSAAAVTADSPAIGGGVGCDGGNPDPQDGGRTRQPQPEQEEDPVQRGGQPLLSQLDAAVLQPHTACFDTGSNRQLHDLTVDEVIDAIQDVELRDKLRTVCLTDDRCYMTFANAECLERALHTAFGVRDVPVLLMDTGAGAVILSLTGVPDTVTDKDVLKCLKKYGTIIGGVERKTARCGTAGGERYVRVRPTLGAPRYLWFGSDKVIVRQLTEHESGTMNSIARRKSFRSQIKLNLKMADAPTPSGDRVCVNENGGGDSSGATEVGDDPCRGNGDGVDVGSYTATAMTAVSVRNGFKFPLSDPKTAAIASQPAAEPKTATAAVTSSSSNSFKSAGSPKKSKAVPTNDRDGGPPSAATVPCESPLRGRRRTSLMGFRRDTIIKHRGGSLSRMDGGEDADSDTSTICRRKLSITGHENTEKVPWCGCWGNGCL